MSAHPRIVAALLSSFVLLWLVEPGSSAQARGSIDATPSALVAGERLIVVGQGFGSAEAVDVYFDRADQRLRVTKVDGTFAGAALEVPGHALPGLHWVTAVGRRTGTWARDRVRVLGTDDWGQLDFNGGRTRWNPDERAISPRTVGTLERSWSAEFGAFGSLYQILADGEVAFVSGERRPSDEAWEESMSFVAAVETTTGRVLWDREFPGLRARVEALADGIPIVSATEWWAEDDPVLDASMVALDPATGAMTWSRELSLLRDSWFAGIAVEGGTAFVTTSHGGRAGRNVSVLLAMDTSDGDVVWRKQFETVSLGPPTISEGTVLLVRGDRLVAFDATSGLERWSRLAPTANEITAARGTAYYVTQDPQAPESGSVVVAIRIADGEEVWSFAWDLWGRVGVAGDLVIAAGTFWESDSGEIWALDASTGKPRWNSRATISSLALVSGVAFTAGSCVAEAYLFGTGTEAWFAPGVSSPLVPVNGRVLTGSCWGDSVALTAFEPIPKPAPRAIALEPDPGLQPDRNVVPQEALIEGWDEVVFDGLQEGDADVAGVASFEGATYIGTTNESGGGLFRSEGGSRSERAGRPGLGDEDNVSLIPVEVGGRLFVVANNPTDGLGVFVSDDGLSFRSIVSGGFGDHETTSAVPYVVDGRLVLGVTNQRTGSQLWRQGDDPDAPFVKVLGVLAEDIDGFAPGSVVFDGATYIGSVDRDGAVLLRTENGMAFEAVDGIGVPRSAGALRPQLVFRGALYVVAADPEGLDVVRTTDGDRFEPVVSGGFDAGQDRNVDGALVAVDERLLLVASAIDPRREPGVAPIEVAPEHGFQLWRSADGTSWDRVDGPGLGDPHSVAAAPIVAGGMAFLAVSNYEEGDAILRSADGLDWEPIFRQSSTAHSSMGLSPFVIDRHLVIFHGDVVSGLSGWRLRAPVEAEAGVPIWVWVVGAGLLTVIGLGSALLFRRRISEPMAGDRIIAPRDRTRVKTGT